MLVPLQSPRHDGSIYLSAERVCDLRTEKSPPKQKKLGWGARLLGVRRETLGKAHEKIGALEVLDGDIVWG